MLEIHLHFTGLSLRGGGWGFALATMMNVALGYFHREIESKETPSCLIDRLLVVFTRQLEILVTALTSVLTDECKREPHSQSATIPFPS